MKTISVIRKYDCTSEGIQSALRKILSQDRYAKSSWLPDGKTVLVTYDARDTLSMFVGWFVKFWILEIIISDNGTLEVRCMPMDNLTDSFTRRSTNRLMTDLFARFEKELNKPNIFPEEGRQI